MGMNGLRELGELGELGECRDLATQEQITTSL